jgi:AbrB family looped-hinge helix DNA binding protein
MKTKLTKRGQTVVPSEIRKRLNLGESTMLQWMVEGDIITVLPIPENPVEALKGSMKGRISFEKFIHDRRSDREMEKTKDS